MTSKRYIAYAPPADDSPTEQLCIPRIDPSPPIRPQQRTRRAWTALAVIVCCLFGSGVAYVSYSQARFEQSQRDVSQQFNLASQRLYELSRDLYDQIGWSATPKVKRNMLVALAAAISDTDANGNTGSGFGPPVRMTSNVMPPGMRTARLILRDSTGDGREGGPTNDADVVIQSLESGSLYLAAQEYQQSLREVQQTIARWHSTEAYDENLRVIDPDVYSGATMHTGSAAFQTMQRGPFTVVLASLGCTRMPTSGYDYAACA